MFQMLKFNFVAFKFSIYKIFKVKICSLPFKLYVTGYANLIHVLKQSLI